MAIQIESAPVGALAALKVNLLSSPIGIRDLSRALEAASPRRIMRPFPIYSGDLEDVLYEDRGLLRSARLTGWYYVVFAGDEIESISEVVKGRLPRYASRQPPSLAKAVLDVLADAEKLDDVKQANYRLRLLRVPELYFLAAWLHSPSEDLLLPVPPTTRVLRDGGPFTEQQVVDALKPIAQVRFDTPDA